MDNENYKSPKCINTQVRPPFRPAPRRPSSTRRPSDTSGDVSDSSPSDGDAAPSTARPPARKPVRFGVRSTTVPAASPFRPTNNGNEGERDGNNAASIGGSKRVQVVRRKYRPGSGSGSRTTSTTSNKNLDTAEDASTEAPRTSLFRKRIRVGVTRKPLTVTTVATTPSTSTESQALTETTSTSAVDDEVTSRSIVSTTHHDQEVDSSVRQSTSHQELGDAAEELLIRDLVTRRIVLVRPHAAFNQRMDGPGDVALLSAVREKTGTAQSGQLPSNKEKFNYELTQTPGNQATSKYRYDDTTEADIAVAAHALSAAPLPTLQTYDDDEDVSTERRITSSTRVPYSPRRPQRTKISTTVPPRITQSVTITRRRKPEPFSRITEPNSAEDVLHRTYRPIIDYDYYDDGDVKVVGKSPTHAKVYLHSSGSIECLDQGNFPHPLSCKKFISCAKMENGGVVGWEYTCPKGLSYDPVGGICNWSAGLGCKE